MAEDNAKLDQPVESIVRSESPLGTILSADAEEDGTTTPGIGVTPSFGSFDTNDDLPLPIVNPVSKAVTTERKHELLLMARADRGRWIHQVPLPYQTVPSGLTPLETFLEQSHASRYLPSAKLILSHLYGQSHAAADARLNDETTQENGALYMSGQQVLKHELDKAEEPRASILQRYQMFLKHLEDTGVLVQGMRSFCRSFTTPTDDRDLQTAIIQMQTYIQATSKSVDDKASLESFIFGHCRRMIEKLVKVEGEDDFKDKLESLQFIESTHLDIKVDENLLPLNVLQSVDSFHSTYEKLQRILQVYHGVNQALKSADADKLPSADDVLPGVIFTVIRAQPVNLLWNLKFIEEWSPPEYLRGEAGYAFTNLFGAVQFLQDLKDPTSLSISKEDFTTKMAACRKSMEERENRTGAIQKIDVVEEEKQKTEETRFPTASDIQEARKRGEVIDIEWALAWQKGLPPAAESPAAPTISGRRQYSFLASRPDDIRIKDLPDLLGEYKDLFETTERLRTEKATESARARRKQTEVAEKDLIDVARSLNLL